MKSDPPHRIIRAAVLVALLLGVVGATHGAAGRTPSVGETFPALSSFPLEGQLPDLSSARVVIVDFWASWCGPCKASFPVFDELRTEFGHRGVVIIAVNVDQDARAMEKFLSRQPPGFTVVRDADQALVATVAPPTMPTSFVLDAQGVVRAVHRGFHGAKTKQDYIAEINQLLEVQP